MNTDRAMKPENLEAQVVVIGGGGAGLCAAVAAAEKGANVILLEKKRKPGGNSAMAGGIFGAESPVQKRMGVDAPRDELFKFHMIFSHWTINPKLVRALIDKSGDTIGWLEEKGLNFTLPPGSRTYFKQQIPLTWHYIDGRGAELIKVIVKHFEDLGGRLLCNTGAKEILIDNKKAVAGVVAARKDEEIRIKANSVIIATGGYGGNKRLLKKYCPEYRGNMQLLGFPNMGDGLVMALKAGAATEGLGILQSEANVFPGEPGKLRRLTTEPNMMWVNKRGERFVVEDGAVCNLHENAHAVIRQPGSTCYVLLDEKIKRNIIEGSGLIVGAGPRNPSGKMPEAEELLKSGIKKGKVQTSDSWDEIANWIGADPKVLKATVDEYNSFCDKGHDDHFAKNPEYLVALRTPPYYAIKSVAGFLGTMGGIKINHHMEVVDHEDNPIPGFYAAGIDTGGWEPETYSILSGAAFGFSVNSGRIAGENAVKYVTGK